MQSTLNGCWCGSNDKMSKREADASNGLAVFRDIDSSSVEMKAPSIPKKRIRTKQSKVLSSDF